jgi:Rod binding domain-containing protein
MSPISGLAAAATTFPLSGTPALGRGQRAAREFEAQLIGTVLESLEKTFAALPGQDAMAGEDDYNYLGTHALAATLAAGGGFGIARMISWYLEDTKVANEGSNAPGGKAANSAKVSVTSADGTR